MSAIKHETAGGTHYRVPPEPRRWPAIGLAVGVHALLLAFLVIGVSWQNNEPVAVEAEVWDVKTQTAAPPPPPPQPEPEPQQETPPPPQPVPKVAPPPPVEQPVSPKQPDIALEREKKRQEEAKKQKLEEQRQEREREQAEREEQKRAEEKKARALAEKKEREDEAKAEKKAQAEAQARKDAEQKKKDEAEKKKKEAAEKKKADEDKKRLDAARAAEMRRITGAAGSTGTTGTAEKSTAPRRDAGYESAIRAKVKGNAAYAGDLDAPGNPTVSFHVEQLPTGEIMSVKMTKSSGIPAFDDAIERAIKASSPLPRKKDGTVERSLEINFKMKDMQ